LTSLYSELFNISKLDLSFLNTFRLFSTNKIFLAPLDIASMPSAPLPANGSKIILLAISN